MMESRFMRNSVRKQLTSTITPEENLALVMQHAYRNSARDFSDQHESAERVKALYELQGGNEFFRKMKILFTATQEYETEINLTATTLEWWEKTKVMFAEWWEYVKKGIQGMLGLS